MVGLMKPDLKEDLAKWISGDLQAVGLVGIKGKGKEDGRWEILRNSFKPYPCGIVIHPIIDGCSQLHVDLHEKSLKLEDIVSVYISVHPLVLELTGKKNPQDSLEAKFSVYHGAAIGLIYGKGTPSRYEDSVVREAHVMHVGDKIDATTDAKLRADECKITLMLVDGTVREKHVAHAVGSLEMPMDDKMLE